MPGAELRSPGAARRGRWLLTAAVGGQLTVSAFQQGLPTLGPALREAYDLSTSGLGWLLTATSLGTAAAVLGWGRLSDRVPDRYVAALGLLATASALGAGAATSSAALATAFLVVAGMFAAAPTVALLKGLARTFPAGRMGLVLGIRQAAVPIGGVLAGLTLPLLAVTYGIGAALGALAVILGLAAALVHLVWAGSGRSPEPEQRHAIDGATWRSVTPVMAASSLYCFTQVGLLSLLVVYLHDERGWSVTAGAAAYSGVMLGAVATRIAVGSRSDRTGGPAWHLFGGIGAATVLALAIAGALGELPLGIPALLVATLLSMSWNSLPFTICSRRVPLHQLGVIQGVLNAVLFASGGIAPAVVATVAETWSWGAAWAMLAGTTVAGLGILAVSEGARERTAR